MRRFAAVLSVVACAAAVSAAAPANAATPQVAARHFTLIQYNSPGDDYPVTNPKLNAEWVTVTNSSNGPLVMTGWHVHDTDGHVYTFPKFTLLAHHSVRIHNGSGFNSPTGLYWHRSYYIWNNTGDTALLTTPAHVVVNSCEWSDPDEDHNQHQCA